MPAPPVFANKTVGEKTSPERENRTMDFSFGVNGSDAIVNGVESFSTETLFALTGWLIVLAIVLYLVLCVGAVFSIIGLVRGIKANNKTVVILGGVGAGCCVIGALGVLMPIFAIGGLACGIISFKKSKNTTEKPQKESKEHEVL